MIGQVGQGGHCRGCLHWGLREGKKYLDPLLLLGNRGGRLRLVAEAQRRIVKREAERAQRRLRRRRLGPEQLPRSDGREATASSIRSRAR